MNLELWLPFMDEPFFTMPHFAITAGQLVAVGVIVFLTWLNCRGVQEGKIVQNIFTVAKTVALILLIVVGSSLVGSSAAWHGATAATGGAASPAPRPFEKVCRARRRRSSVLIALMVVGGAMVGALFSADAWNNITFTAGEIKNPRRNLP